MSPPARARGAAPPPRRRGRDRRGPPRFYEGEVARRLVEFNRAGGGWLTTDDLAEFRAEVAPAVSRSYGGWLVHTPDTWCQGPALLQTLAILDGFDLPALGHNTAATSTFSPSR